MPGLVFFSVMAGLDPAILVSCSAKPGKTWMPGRRAEATPFFERLWPDVTKRVWSSALAG
jgi:hypothetical protein